MLVRLQIFLDNTWPHTRRFIDNKLESYPMKKKKQQQQQRGTDEKERELEIIKAVAQAWYGKSSSYKPSTNEFDAHRRNFKSKPSRFKLEAIRKASSSTRYEYGSSSSDGKTWDFGDSLWDSYEIVTISKRLERGLVLDNTFSAEDEAGHAFKKRKASTNSLINILNRMSSRRFNEPIAPNEEGNESIK